MRVLILSLGQDTGGQGIRTKLAFDRLEPAWTVRSMASSQTYLAYPTDLVYRRRLAMEFYREADVVHLKNGLHARQGFDRGQRKPIVLHHHGTAFRNGHARLYPAARSLGAIQLVSTLDLELLEPDLRWMPAPYNLATLAEIRSLNYRPADDVIRIAHAPTDRTVKSTDLILATVERLAKRHSIRMVLIERRPWAECLALKATADIYVDQLILGYGCNAVEAWGMGIPVIAGVADPAVRARMLEVFGHLPFLEASVDTLESRLELLIRSVRARREWAARGAEHATRFHDERVVVPMLKETYLEAFDRRGQRAA